MDWLKVKKSLICIFVMLNIILAVMYNYRLENIYTLSKEEEQHIKQLLYDNGIVVYDLISKPYYPMSKLSLKPRKIDEDKFIRNFFGKSESIKLIEDDKLAENNVITEYTKGNETITIDNNKATYFFHSNNSDEGKYPPSKLNQTEVVKSANLFVNDFVYDNTNFELCNIRKSDDYFEIHYSQKYKNKKMFCSYIRLKVYSQGITEAEMIFYDPIQFIDDERSIYPPDEVLFNFMNFILKNKIESSNKIFIKDIDVGYDLGLKSTGEEIYAIALPYYRIIIGSGEVYYINAYKNEIRQNNSL